MSVRGPVTNHAIATNAVIRKQSLGCKHCHAARKNEIKDEGITIVAEKRVWDGRSFVGNKALGGQAIKSIAI